MPVNTNHKDYDKFAERWQRCRDVAAGQDAVHEAGDKYLPKLKDQVDVDYKAYKLRATFYNATWRTIAGLIGMMLRQPPEIEVPNNITELLDDIDAAGQPMQLFAQEVCENALVVGRLGILVDVPAIVVAPGVTATMADAKVQNVRPTMQIYRAESIINWKTGRVANKTVLTMLVLKECEQIAEDEFKAKDEDRWRVLDLVNNVYRVRIFKRRSPVQAGAPVAPNDFEQVGTDLFPVMGGKTMAFIPFIFLSSDDTSCDVYDPPLIDLVDLNLSHYRTTADYSHGCHFTGLPTLFLAGFKLENPSDKIYIGSESAMVSSNPEAKAQYVEFSGQGLQSLKEKLDREEQQMAILGARMLEPQKKAAEAADSGSIRRKGEESMLSSVAQAISLGLTQALKWFVEFAAADPTKVKFELNRDFYPARMTPEELSALISAWQLGAISDQVLFANLQQGEIIDRDTTIEEEQARVAARQQQLADQAAALNASMNLPGGKTAPPVPPGKGEK